MHFVTVSTSPYKIQYHYNYYITEHSLVPFILLKTILIIWNILFMAPIFGYFCKTFSLERVSFGHVLVLMSQNVRFTKYPPPQ